MKELKFRSWDKKENRFWYFDLQKVLERQLAYMGSWDRKIAIGEKSQYIGIKDINGKEIYEGDIVKVESYDSELRNMTGQVMYSEIDASYWVIEGTKENHFGSTISSERNEYKVIGNVYENKELVYE